MKTSIQHSMKRKLLSAVAAALAVTAVTVSAQTLYKSIMPDGRIVYGSKPEKGAARVDKVEPKLPLIEVEPQTNEAQRKRDKEQLEAMEKRLAERKTARDKAEQEIFAAKEALTAAEKALEEGKTPLPGERLSTADGGSRLSEAYAERLKRTEEDVAKARDRLETAYRARADLN